MKDLKYHQILGALNDLRKGKPSAQYRIKILSNIIVNQLADILEYSLRISDTQVSVEPGNYDNILQDASELDNDYVVIVFWELSNLIDGFEYKIDSLSQDQLDDLINKTEGELLMVFNSLKSNKQVVFNAFHSKPFGGKMQNDRFNQLAHRLNYFVSANAPKNFKVVSLDSVLSGFGNEESFDLRNFYSSRALYSIGFFKKYVASIVPIVDAVVGRKKKVLVLDCDNTLWKGVLGEDGADGIRMSAAFKDGIPFEAVQYKILKLYNEGVILCLCSKNNPEDVNDVLSNHPDMLIRDEHIVLKKVNWQDKASNLREIASELNLGLDSIVFVDDSDFEINLVRNQLPEVTSFQVPKKGYSYPALMDEVIHLFQSDGNTSFSDKTVQYKQQGVREATKSSFENIESYLKSLELEIELKVNQKELLPRMAEMTQKTNQFNLTTKRYTEPELAGMLLNGNCKLVALSVKDKYGDSGITGLAILIEENEKALIDTFLMSCRVIGRNIEYQFFNQLIKMCNSQTVVAHYNETMKNAQVSEFYDKLGFTLVGEENTLKTYELDKNEYSPKDTMEYIKIRNEG